MSSERLSTFQLWLEDSIDPRAYYAAASPAAAPAPPAVVPSGVEGAGRACRYRSGRARGHHSVLQPKLSVSLATEMKARGIIPLITQEAVGGGWAQSGWSTSAAALKILKRHLKSTYDMTLQQYREQWSLPSDYPMTASSYSDRRSEPATEIGLGHKSDAEADPAQDACSGGQPPCDR